MDYHSIMEIQRILSKKRLFQAGLALLSFFCLQQPVFSRSIIGVVIDAAEEPIANAIVRCQGAPSFILTDSTGNFRIDLDNPALKSQYITAWKEGYYNGGQKINNNNTLYRIVLYRIPQEDNEKYLWIPSLLSNRNPIASPVINEKKSCQACHPSIVDEWQQDAHSQSSKNPFNSNFFER